jgi:hypothetical protein
MTRKQYLDKLDELMDTVVKITEKVTEPRDYIEILKLELDIVDKVYELTKEETR